MQRSCRTETLPEGWKVLRNRVVTLKKQIGRVEKVYVELLMYISICIYIYIYLYNIYIYTYVGLIVDDLCFVRQQLLLAELLVFEVACRMLVGLGLRPKRLTWELRT